MSDLAMEYGYGVFDTGDGLELQRVDDLEVYQSDREAAQACLKDARDDDPYAIECIKDLAEDYIARGGVGRLGDKHDMDVFALWGGLPK